MTAPKEDHVASGWNAEHTLRWIEVGRLRIEEDDRGGRVLIQAPYGPTWLSASELAAMSRLLAGWFADDPTAAIRRIETCATFVKLELEVWNRRARADEEHPPYDHLTHALDVLLAKCRELREIGVLAVPESR